MKRLSSIVFVTALALGIFSTPLAIMAQDAQTPAQAAAVAEPVSAPAVLLEQGQAVVAPADGPAVTDGDLLKALAQAANDIIQVVKKEGAAKIAIVLAVIGALVQFFLMFLKSPRFGAVFKQVPDLARIAIIGFLTTLLSALAMYQAGAGLGAIFLTGGLGTSLLMSGYRIWEAFKGTKPEAKPA